MAEEPRRIEQAADGLNQLKALLFQGEARRLGDIEREVERLGGRVGDAPALERATAEILVDSLRRAEVARHRELADAIAPVVVAAIRNEIRNSREMMVEALYPLTGQLVVAAVQNAFRELVASLNQRVDALTSVDRWKLRIRAKRTGRPLSELAMEQTGAGKVTRLLFLENGSGRMLASWRADARDDDRADLAGGLIAAITGFARDALDAGSNELRTLDFGGRKTYLRNSPQTIVAAEVEGELTRGQVPALDQAFLALLKDYGGDGAVGEDALAVFAARVGEAGAPAAKKSPGWPLKIAAAGALLLLAALAGRAGGHWLQERDVDQALAAAIAARPGLAAFPVSASVDHSAGRVILKAVLPSAADARALADTLAGPAGGYAVVSHVALLATAAGVESAEQKSAAAARELEGRLADARRNLDALTQSSASAAQVDELRARVESVAAAGASAGLVADLRARIDAIAAFGAETRSLNEKVAGMSETLSRLNARLNTPRARLAALIEGFAVFFSDGDNLLDEAVAGERLKAVASLAIDESLGIRVVGNSDASGGTVQNLAIARKRAEAVADILANAGMDRKRITVVSRGAAMPIAEPDPQTRERNRRVTLEPLYDNEARP